MQTITRERVESVMREKYPRQYKDYMKELDNLMRGCTCQIGPNDEDLLYWDDVSRFMKVITGRIPLEWEFII